MAEIERARQAINLPVSIRGSFQGTAQAFQASLGNEVWLILAALVTVYIVLGILYESYIHPLTILSGLPFAAVGALAWYWREWHAGRAKRGNAALDADAKTAGLWGKDGPWRNYPWRQIAWRAFWFAARDAAADLLRGMGGFEEGVDTPPPAERHMGAADVVQPPAAAALPGLPPYSPEAFAANLPKWRDLVESGRKTAADLMAMLATKASFTEEQRAEVLNLKPAAAEQAQPPAAAPADPVDDDFIRDMDAAEVGGK